MRAAPRFFFAKMLSRHNSKRNIHRMSETESFARLEAMHIGLHSTIENSFTIHGKHAENALSLNTAIQSALFLEIREKMFPH